MHANDQLPDDSRTERELRLEEAARREIAPGYMSDLREWDREH